jgi:hypothetical protein
MSDFLQEVPDLTIELLSTTFRMRSLQGNDERLDFSDGIHMELEINISKQPRSLGIQRLQINDAY